MQVPIFSFIIPTHGRPESLLKLLNSFKANTANLQSIEIILIIDEDDNQMADFMYEDIRLKCVRVKPGLNMGALNMAGYNISSGQYIMLLNDDVVIQTAGWDEKVLSCFKCFSDGIVLVHVNDLIFGEKLCTFPLVSRVFCDIMGGICPTEYRRHRIDDHIYNIFNLLGVLGENRIVYLPDVIFEHNHYTIGKGGKREYKQSDVIDESDKALFEDLLPERKQITFKLMEHIVYFSQQERIENRKKQLDKVTNSFSAKKIDHVNVRPNEYIPQSKNSRVTIGVVSADCKSGIARRCIEKIKKHTSNYDLILLDNNFGTKFNHPVEMNRIIEITRTDFLVLMDDDVFVEVGWLDGLLRYMDSGVGVVTPLHKDCNGSLSYAGIIFNPDESGDHGHIISHLESPTPTITLCSALLLIDIKKCGHIRFNESYNKYFLDIDYGLRIWESGFQIICSPDATITHIGGGTLTHGSRLVNKLFEEQRHIFDCKWIKTNRFSKLKDDVFQKVPELRSQLDLSSQVYYLLASDPYESMSAFRIRAADLFKKIEPYPSLKKFILDQICKTISWNSLNVRDPDNGHLIVLLGLSGHPVLIEQGYKGFNILLRCQVYYAVPQTEKVFDLEHIKRGEHSIFYLAENLDYIKEQIDRDMEKGFVLENPSFSQRVKDFIQLQYTRCQLALRASFWIARKIFLSIVKEVMSPAFRRSVVIFVRLQCHRVQVVLRNPGGAAKETQKGVSQKIQKTDFRQRSKAFFRYRYNHFRMALHAETQRWVIQANFLKPVASLVAQQDKAPSKGTEDNEPTPVLMDKNYKGYIIVRNTKEFHAFNIDELNRDLTSVKPRFSAHSEGGIRRLIHEGVPRLIEKDYKGFAIFSFEHFFFAIESPEGVFSLKNFQEGEYAKYAIAYSVLEVKDVLDSMVEDQEQVYQTRCLFFDCLAKKSNVEPILHGYENSDITFLVKKIGSRAWPDSKTLVLEGDSSDNKADFCLDSLSPEFLGRLRSMDFNRIIVPSDLSETWRNNSKIQLAAELSDKVEIAYSPGNSRLYAGETLKRLLYNTAYLSSIFQVVNNLEGKDVLEVGCSDGLVCDILSQLCANKVDGVDILKSTGCGFSGNNIAYHVMDSTNMHFPDRSYDLVLSIATLEHVADPFRVLTELKRLTKVGGLCYVQAGPLYHSPFGHHMFDFFQQYPWIHLQLSIDEIIQYTKAQGIDKRIHEQLAIACEDYIPGMLNSDHINGLFLDDYRLGEFMAANDIKVEKFKIHCEGREYLTPEILSQFSCYEPNRLIEHGFELAFRRL